MDNPAWWFVLASVIAVVGITVVFKQLIGEMEAKLEKQETVAPASFQTYISRFFTKVALIEAIPIILTVVGFMQLDGYEGNDQNSMMLPLVVVIISWLFGIVNVWLTRSRILSIHGVADETKKYLHTVLFIGIGMISVFPILAIVAVSVIPA